MYMSGWPSGLRRQTQGYKPSFRLGAIWSTNVGVGSNPTSDNPFQKRIIKLNQVVENDQILHQLITKKKNNFYISHLILFEFKIIYIVKHTKL